LFCCSVPPRKEWGKVEVAHAASVILFELCSSGALRTVSSTSCTLLHWCWREISLFWISYC